MEIELKNIEKVNVFVFMMYVLVLVGSSMSIKVNVKFFVK